MEANSDRFIPSTIPLIVDFLGNGNYEEGICGSVNILPGMLIREDATEELIPHDVSAGVHPKYIAIENAIIGNTKDVPYTDGERVRYQKARSGNVFLMHLKAGQNVAVGDLLMSNGDGTLIKLAGAGAVPVGRVKTDAVNLTAIAENDWVRVEIY